METKPEVEQTSLTPPAAAAPPVETAEVMRIKNDRAMAEFESPFASAAAYRHFMNIAETFAKSIFVPVHFQGKPGDCLIAMNLAKNMQEDPLQVMQNIFVVGGRPGFYTSFMIARANSRAGFKSKIRWTVETLSPAVLAGGMPNLRVTAWALDAFGERIDASVDSTMALGEGWTKNAKYKSMPEHMLRWRAAAFLIRLYAPEVMMGMQTVEEVETMPQNLPVSPSDGGKTESLVDRLARPVAAAVEVQAGTAMPVEDESQETPAGDPEPTLFEQKPFVQKPPERLSQAQLAEIMDLASKAGVAIDALEEWAGMPLNKIEGPTAAEVEADVVAEIRKRSAVKGKK